MDLRYLNFLLTQSNTAHNVHTSGLVRLGVLCVGFLEDLLVVGTISRLVGFRDFDSYSVFLPRPSAFLTGQRLVVDIGRAIVGQSISRVNQKRITIGRRLQDQGCLGLRLRCIRRRLGRRRIPLDHGLVSIVFHY
jgi:hypothetical protein